MVTAAKPEQQEAASRPLKQMETYDWAWVQNEVERTVGAWYGGSRFERPAPRLYSAGEQRDCEEAYDEALYAVEGQLQQDSGGADPAQKRNRIVEAFGRFSARALDLDAESLEVLTEDFLPVGTELACWARQFDSGLSMPSIIQAARNAWTACGLQPLLGARIKLTPAILGYSLLYPYSDNYLDEESITAAEKMRFSRRFRSRLMGEMPAAEDRRERAIWALIAMIEMQYPRDRYPQVFDSLLAIHRGQEESIRQVDRQQITPDIECLRVSCAKGGSSVLADACLAHGHLDEDQSRFAFEWGVLLQLGDDLQDVQEDMRRGSMTLFSRAAVKGILLDTLTRQLFDSSERVWDDMEKLSHGTHSYRELLKMSWRSLIIRAVADSHEFFSPDFLKQAERCSPFRFDFLRARGKRLTSRHGLYATLFDALLTPGKMEGEVSLPAPERVAEWFTRAGHAFIPSQKTAVCSTAL